ncbi:outer membrane protein [Methylopila turkensis]|uniref:Outer membrane protein n=1 Tax=Methylopila turkensis TaxID=1437816 RepID=A0A9W6N515_9HYPH|nr:outer membrane protein [Methylopila turkensis]GLK78714.1 outer membrane protein [Methylopila turkensis]
MIRSIVIAASVAALGAAPALAADLPYETPAGEYAAPASGFTWSGAYVGAQAGYGWAKANNRQGRDTKPSGAIVGGYAGYNHQFDASPVVVGVETDVNYNDGSDRKVTAATRIRNEQQWSGATRAKVGYAYDRYLAYGAAGVAYSGQKVSGRVGADRGSDDKTAVGYTVGAGVEGAVTDNVTARLEYRYTDYGTDKYRIGGSREKTDVTENRVMGGVAYKFGSAW